LRELQVAGFWCKPVVGRFLERKAGELGRRRLAIGARGTRRKAKVNGLPCRGWFVYDSLCM